MADGAAVADSKAEEPLMPEADSPWRAGKAGSAVPEYIQCLQRALSARGEVLSSARLMGLSGEAFRFFFSASDPGLGVSVVGHNPLRAAASALGYDCKILFSPQSQEALKLLGDALAAGHGPLLLHGASGWLVVESEEQAEGRGQNCQPSTDNSSLRCLRGWRPETVASPLSAEELLKEWREEPGLLELGRPGHYLFALGEKARKIEEREANLGALRRAYRQVFRLSQVAGCAGGLIAYQELALVLRRKRRAAQSANDLHKYALWHSLAVAPLLEARRAAAAYLGEIKGLFDEDEQKHLLKALHCFEQVVASLERLPRLQEREAAVLAETGESPSDEKRKAWLTRRLWWRRRKALREIERLSFLEKTAAEELQRVVEVAGRKARAR